MTLILAVGEKGKGSVSYDKIEAAIREYKENEAQEWMSETPEQHTARVLCEWTERLCEREFGSLTVWGDSQGVVLRSNGAGMKSADRMVRGATLIDALANMLEALRDADNT